MVSASSSVARPIAPVAPRDVMLFLRLIADEARLAIVHALAHSDLRAGEIGALTRLPSNALSYHLKRLSALGLLQSRQSSADARDVYYHLDVGRLHSLYAAAGNALYPSLLMEEDTQSAMSAMSAMHAAQRDTRAQAQALGAAPAVPLRVLFLCTHNSARSQMAEALLRHMGGDQVEVYSAGSQPTEVHPEALAALQERGIEPRGLYAKSLDQFIDQRFDYVITVCDRVRDVCPSFPGDPAPAHWSIADPAIIENAEQRANAFRTTLAELQTRIRYLLLLPHPRTGERFRAPTL